jgi:hypothetical protein
MCVGTPIAKQEISGRVKPLFATREIVPALQKRCESHFPVPASVSQSALLHKDSLKLHPHSRMFSIPSL